MESDGRDVFLDKMAFEKTLDGSETASHSGILGTRPGRASAKALRQEHAQHVQGSGCGCGGEGRGGGHRMKPEM